MSELDFGANLKDDRKIELTAIWGNGDAESTITVSKKIWNDIQNGGKYNKKANSWYEGDKYSVTWAFQNKMVTIEDNAQYVLDACLEDLFLNEL